MFPQQTFAVQRHVLHRVDTSSPELDVMPRKRPEQQAGPVQVIHVQVHDLKRFAAEENVGGLVARAVLRLLIISHRLRQPNRWRRLLIVIYRHDLYREQIVEPDDVARLVEEEFDSV